MKKLTKEHPNDYELGKTVRSIDTNSEMKELAKNYPNDYELGKTVRKLYYYDR
tara:strand:+ start:4536 stop:4694 length:159 start_codon:yes stop_codon:yes gene_type:complete